MKYKMVKSKSDLDPRINTYGIEAVENGHIMASVPDISTDKTYVKTLIELFNKHKLSTIHLKDAVEDFLVK